VVRGILAAGVLVISSCAPQLSLPKGVSWDSRSGTFSWSGGRVTLPVGFRYQVDRGLDTFIGHFTSPDGTMVIHHDIGAYAGAWAAREKSLAFEEKVVDGARVWTADHGWPDW